MNNKGHSLPYTIKGKPTLYLVLFVASIAMIVFLIINIDTDVRIDDFFSLVGVALLFFPTILIIISLYIRSFRIIIYDDKIKYRKFRLEEKTISFSEIKKLEIKNYFGYGDKYPKKSGLYLNIYTKDKIFMIYANFGRKNLTFLIKTISDKISSLEMNNFAKQVKIGNFEGITLGTFGQFLSSGLVERSLRK